jgi:hypothetical protein
VGHYGIVTKWPCLPLSSPACHHPASNPPTGPGWVHEIKHDGYRLMARRDLVSVGDPAADQESTVSSLRLKSNFSGRQGLRAAFGGSGAFSAEWNHGWVVELYYNDQCPA